MSKSSPWKGQEVANGRYRLTEQLGEGGMGVVYRAWDKHLQTDVVLKAPKASLLSGDKCVRRFGLEVRSLVRLAHPHIVQVLDVGEHAGLPFVVMQFLPGGSLQQRQPEAADGQAAPMPPATLGVWLEDVAAAVDFVHRKGFVHRDIKPANILFDAEGNVYLSDFGVAKALTSLAGPTQTAQTGTGNILGTPGYMAPEVLRGEAFDGRADQYALAMTVYEVLTGRCPFRDLPLLQAALQQQEGLPLPLERVLPSIPRGVSAAVQKALAQDPNRRFPTCEAFAQAVLTAAGTPAGTFAKTAPLPPARSSTLVAGSAATPPLCPGTPPTAAERPPALTGATSAPPRPVVPPLPPRHPSPKAPPAQLVLPPRPRRRRRPLSPSSVVLGVIAIMVGMLLLGLVPALVLLLRR